MDITKIDKNFKAVTLPEGVELEYFDVKEKPFRIFGVTYEDGMFRRMPKKVAESVSEGVEALHKNTAGGRVSFKTDSRYIAVAAKIPEIGKMSHMTTIGFAGFDIYANGVFKKSFFPDYNFTDGFNAWVEINDKSEKEIVINFPTYSCVSELYIGIEKGSTLKECNPYKNIKPVVYYGSSITQGGCCSRPGNTYQAEITRRTGVDHINLGFSGSALAEDTMVEYIANLDMSIFVMDYDHNAPSVEHLEKTHEKMFKKIREKNKDLPVIFVSKPDISDDDTENILKRDVIYETYRNAVAAGDTNVYYIDGRSLFTCQSRDFCTVDGTHPNDLGFYLMANVIGETVGKLINTGRYNK